MAVLALISELMMQSQLSAAAAAAGAELEIATSGDSLVALAESRRPQLVIVDLTHPALDPQALAARLRVAHPEGTLLAFGPHVHRERLAAAAEAGFHVLSRGQFHAQMADILKRTLE
jgi:DNA-binding response OmpR family regulator